MPFPITHLGIAKRLTALCSYAVRDLPQFYLGTLAPDSVHFRKGATPQDKKTTHLCVGSEKWGEITNNSEWLDNVLVFLAANKQSVNFDFIYGFCAHIIADIYNNINVWTPIRLKHLADTEKGYAGICQNESAKVDQQLAKTAAFVDEVSALLSKSQSIAIPDIVCKEEIDEIKCNILIRQYSNDDVPDTSANLLITYDGTIRFIERAATYISEKTFAIIEQKERA